MSHKVLFVVSNPVDTDRLRLDKENRDVEEGLKRSNERDQFTLIKISAARIDDLRRSLLDHSPHIVHFSGHGAGIDGIVLEDADGLSQLVPNDALSNLFSLCSDSIECVILNACYSDLQATEIAKHIPYVVGMSSSISDDAATEFSVAFYDALGAGKGIDTAYKFGCNAIALRGILGHLTPVLKTKALTASERAALRIGRGAANELVCDVSAIDVDNKSWNRGEDMTVHYFAEKRGDRVQISYRLGYLELFEAGGPITPLHYLSSTYCPFLWDFPSLDFKFLNNGKNTRFLTEIVFDVIDSHCDLQPLFTIKQDVQQRFAGELLLVNEGWCDLFDLNISFNLVPGQNLELEVPAPPYRHSIDVELLSDQINIDVTSAFEHDGVDIGTLVVLGNGKWENEQTYVIERDNGALERLTLSEVQAKEQDCFGPFSEQVGTLVGEISFALSDGSIVRYKVKFRGVVYLANANRVGLPRPPSATYDVTFETEATSYQRRVPISHDLQPGAVDRLAIKVAIRQSSSHNFSPTVREITGHELKLQPVQMKCFVPRSRRNFVESKLNGTGI